MSTKVSQKEYLKKYLSSNKSTDHKKKKKKSKNVTGKSIKIIDDDDHNLDGTAKMTEEELEMYAMGEDAPQIVGVIDDRPPELIAKEDYSKSIKWKGLDSGNSELLSNNDSAKQNNDLSPLRKNTDKGQKKRHRSPDQSPPRRKFNKTPDSSPRRRLDHSPDQSPPRRRFNRSSELSPRRRVGRSPNQSPTKRKSNRSPDLSPRGREKRSFDQSPPRRKSNQSPDLSSRKPVKRSPDKSPPRRKQNRSPDSSPRRRTNFSPESSKRNQRRHNSPSKLLKKTEKSPDLSPPRQRKLTTFSPDFTKNHRQHDKDSGTSPQNKRYRKNFDLSPVADRSSSRNVRNYREYSPTEKYRNSGSSSSKYQNKRNISESPPPTHKPRNQRDNDSETEDNGKSAKTLDGKTAGLQDAKSLRIESDRHRKREDELFRKMEAESGRDADVVVRDRRTGRKRDLERESAKDLEKRIKEQERQLVYDRWGKGLKQVEDYKARVESDLHEVNKPLARYSDDKDLDEMLKQQDRDGDPMAEYMRKKQETKKSGQPAKPIYRGSYPENRFSIRPGYRWDGVDRSNGYEVKWFNVQSQKKAGEEEAYKYSTEDM